MVEAHDVTELMGDQPAHVGPVLDPQLAPHEMDVRTALTPDRGVTRVAVGVAEADDDLCLAPTLDLPEFHAGTRAVPRLRRFAQAPVVGLRQGLEIADRVPGQRGPGAL